MLVYLEKVKVAINRWQAKYLNMAGRCTLIKSAVSSFPVYGMQSSLLPVSVMNEIEKDCRKFLWNKVDKSHYLARLSWDRICSPTGKGGLGFRRLHNWNLAFMAKLGWMILKNETKFWVRILKARYWEKGSFLSAVAKNHHSPIWRDILKGRELLEKGLVRRIGNGRSTSIWYHWWVGEGPLVDVMGSNIPEFMSHWQVSNIIKRDRWDTKKISHLLPLDIIKQIGEIPLASMSEVEDDFTWNFEKNGTFSVKSAYYLINRGEEEYGGKGLWRGLWRKNIPFKYKLLIWNGIHNILPSALFLARRIHNFNPHCGVRSPY